MIHKKRFIILSLIFALIIFSGCQQNGDLAYDKQEEAAYSEAIKVVDKFLSSTTKGNYDTAFNLYDLESLATYEDGSKMDLERFTKEWKEGGIVKFEIVDEGVIKYSGKYVVQTIVYFESDEILIIPFVVAKKENGFLIQGDTPSDAPPYVHPRVLVPDKNSMQY